jgi:ParB family chromosome partitioning protein
VSKQRGLPATARMRHDQHYVEQLATRQIETVGRQVAIDELVPNPAQPRQSIGDLEELVASIRNVGILEPLLVRQTDDGFQIISGERRYRAAKVAGLEQVPCIIMEVDDAEVLEIALIENLQRQDLSPFEESEGLHALVEQFGHTHEEVARRIGKSRSSVTETLSLVSIPVAIRQRLNDAGVSTKSILLEIARRETEEDQAALANLIIKEGLTRDDLRALRRSESEDDPVGEAPVVAEAARPSPAPPRRLTYRSGHGITVTLYLSRQDIGIPEIQQTLREAINELDGPDSE